jgi:site-specific recombinase XerD
MDNNSLIKKFNEFQKANAISPKRILKYNYTLNKMAKILNKPYPKATKDDIIKVVAWVEERPFTAWTKHDYKICLKRFYKWLNGDEDFPDTVRWIKSTVKKNDERLPDDLLTEEEVDALVNASTKTRDKALVRCLYESGCRIHELLNLQIKQITFDEYSPIITIHGKTGARRLRLIDKQGLLKAWLQSHPFKDNPDAYVWISMAVNKTNKPLEYHAIVKILRELAKRCGLKKKVNPHNFRHSRATHLAIKLTEAQMKQMFGWTQSSDMASVYVHLSGRDLDEPLLKMSGLLAKKDAKKQKLGELLKEEILSDPESAKLFDKILDRLDDKGKLKQLE